MFNSSAPAYGIPWCVTPGSTAVSTSGSRRRAAAATRSASWTRLAPARTTSVDERAVALGRSFFGPLIEDVVGAVEDLSEPELAAVRRFLAAVHAGVTTKRHG